MSPTDEKSGAMLLLKCATATASLLYSRLTSGVQPAALTPFERNKQLHFS